MFIKLKQYIQKNQANFGKFVRFSSTSDLANRTLVLILALLILFTWHFFLPNFLINSRVEFVGLVFDIIFILIIFQLFESGKNRRIAIDRQREVIEDFKRWDNEEAHYRMAGAIRRLAKLGIYEIDLHGCTVTDFQFCEHEIKSLRGSKFYDGNWGVPTHQTDVKLTRVRFDFIDCRDVIFSPFNPLGGLMSLGSRPASLVDCSFVECDLRHACFNGASLKWTTRPPPTHYNREEDENGEPFYVPISYSSFHGANLEGTSFEGTHFENADFREAENISKANFREATGLESCYFDDDGTRKIIIDRSKLHVKR